MVAYWIMDDVSFNKLKGNLILCTDSYSKEDVTNKFNFSCGIIDYGKNKKRAKFL